MPPSHVGQEASPAGDRSGCRTDDAAAAGVAAGAAEGVVTGPAEAVPVGPEDHRGLVTRTGTSDHRAREHNERSAPPVHSSLAGGTGPSVRPQRAALPRAPGIPHGRLTAIQSPPGVGHGRGGTRSGLGVDRCGGLGPARLPRRRAAGPDHRPRRPGGARGAARRTSDSLDVTSPATHPSGVTAA